MSTDLSARRVYYEVVRWTLHARVRKYSTSDGYVEFQEPTHVFKNKAPWLDMSPATKPVVKCLTSPQVPF